MWGRLKVGGGQNCPPQGPKLPVTVCERQYVEEGMPIHLPHVRLSVPMLLSLAEWSVFSLYWNAAAKNSSPAKSEESRPSRRVHELLVNLALLLVVFPFPGLPGRRFLPGGPYTAWAGLCIQTASGTGRMGAAASRPLLERGDRHQGRSPPDPVRPLPLRAASYLHRDAGDVCRHGGCVGPTARGSGIGDGGFRILAQDPIGGGQPEEGVRSGVRCLSARYRVAGSEAAVRADGAISSLGCGPQSR